MEVDTYAHITSPIHSWDIRFKLVSLMVSAFIAASCRNLPPIFLASSLSIILVVISHLPFLFVLRTLRAPLILLLVMAPVLICTSGGEPIASIWKVTFYTDGLYKAELIALKLFSVLFITVTLFGTAKLHDTMKGMEKLKVPRKLTAIFLFTYRYIFLSMEVMKVYFLAARLRGYSRIKGFRRLKTSVDILTSLLIRSYEQSERVYVAMHLRGFSGSYPTLTAFHINGTDILKSGITLAAGGIVVCLEFL